jgi:hypothetical protein
MGILGYENGRVHFDLILRLYKDYLRLYADINGGSLDGSTTFADFYWTMTYFSKYSGHRNFGRTGY